MPLPAKLKAQRSEKHRSLLFQFVLSELILAHQSSRAISQLIYPQENISKELSALLHLFSKLSGPSHQQMRLFSWNDDGVLTKLKNYCSLLCEYDQFSSKQTLSMERESTNAWMFSVQALDRLRELSSENNDTSSLINLYNKTNKSLEKVTKTAFQSIKNYRKDENVIFFLIRNKDSLDDVFGEHFTAKTIKSLFPHRGVQGAANFLIDEYKQRGFISLVPHIESHISGFQK